MVGSGVNVGVGVGVDEAVAVGVGKSASPKLLFWLTMPSANVMLEIVLAFVATPPPGVPGLADTPV